MKMKYLKQVCSQTKNLKGCYDPFYLQLNYNTKTNELLLDEHYDLGHNWLSHYEDESIVFISIIEDPLTMKEIRNMVEQTLKRKAMRRMKRIYLSLTEYEAIKCTGDIDYIEILEGTLLDNELIEINGVMYAAYEHVLNSNSSDLYVEIATTDKEKEIVTSNFEQFKKSYISDRIWDYIHYSRYSIDNNFKRDVNTGEKIFDPMIVNQCLQSFYKDCIESLEYYCDDKEECKQYIKDYIKTHESRCY